MSCPGTFETRVRRLMRFRYPLLFAAVLNAVFVISVPFARRPATARSVAEANPRDDDRASEAQWNPHRPKRHARADQRRATNTNGNGVSAGSSEPRGDGAVQVELGQVVSREATNDFASANVPNRDVTPPSRNSRDSRPSAVGVWIWQLGMASAEASRWYERAEKQDPFAGPSFASSGRASSMGPEPSDERPVRSELAEGEAATSSGQASTSAPAKHGRVEDDVVAGSPAVVLRNPADNGVAVAFVVHGRVFVLEPGAEMEWRTEHELPIAFDRGADFGVEQTKLRSGNYEFVPTERGWRVVRRER